MHLRHILVPTDFSAASAEAFDTALDMAQATGARMTLFHVHHVPSTVFPDVIMPLTPNLLRDVEHSADQVLQELCERAGALGVVADFRTSFGTTHSEICAVAEELDADLIVIGTHGRGGISHAVLGSVAEKVVRKAPCPVLTVRPQMHASFVQP